MSAKDFHSYLQKAGLRPKTIEGYFRNLGYFREWCRDNSHADPARLRHTDLLVYVRYEKEKGIATHTLNDRIHTLRQWYAHLIEKGETEHNPAKGLHVRNKKQTVHKDLLEWQEIEQLCESYTARNRQAQAKRVPALLRNTVLLGLLGEQALQACELPLLQTGHIDLKKGTVTVPNHSRGAERELKLAPHQVLELYQYLNGTRKELLKQLLPHQRQAAEQAETLFPGDMTNIVNHLFKTLRKINPKVRNAFQLRGSILMQWVKMYGLRQVQYMAGHRQVSTTEIYTRQDTDSLRDRLVKYHPFG